MDKKQQEFLKRLRETFRIEADEHLRAMSSGVLRLEKGLPVAEQAATVEVVFREAHSLKGAARAVNVLEIEAICQGLEGVFAALKRGEVTFSPPLFDRLHAALTLMSHLLSAMGIEPSAADQARVTQVVRSLGEALRGPVPLREGQGSDPAAAESVTVVEPRRPGVAPGAPAAEKPPEPPSPAEEAKASPAPANLVASPPAEKDALPLPETVRISTAKLNAILLQAEEMLAVKLAMGQRVAELREASALLGAWERERAKIKPELRTLFRGMEKNGKDSGNGGRLDGRSEVTEAVAKVAVFSQWTEEAVKALHTKLAALGKAAEQDRRVLSTMVDRLLEDTRKALMLPFTTFLEAVPMLVRDLARDNGKEVELVVQGGESEVDRRILEEMKDPLVHLVRNSIDHGIEKPQERKRKNKRPQGQIIISIAQREGGKVEILVADDGAGINLPAVRAAGTKSGAVSAQESEKMDNAALASLVFRSGVSTSPLVTDISGRGLGLAIVREKVDKLGGSLAVETRAGEGTSFRITLPLTLAAFRGILVRAEEQLFIVPSAQAVHSLRLKREQIKSVENREAIEHEGKVIALVRLADVLGMARKPAPGATDPWIYVLVLSSAEQRIAFALNEVLEEQEVLVKSLGQQLPHVRNIAGAAVLGNGKVVPVLNVAELMQSALNVKSASSSVDVETKPQKRPRLLVAEDSITTRTLLKSILESAGYTVKTAVDGVDALTSLRAEPFDLVVSDVDMPRMNGFGLTSAIRTDRRLAELPVVLVTALDSREDRERGIDVGANAYLVKSSFEQSNLLEVVRRLV